MRLRATPSTVLDVDARTRLWLWAGVAFTGAVVLTAATSQGATIKPGPGKRLLLLGDSLAVGLGTPLRTLATDARAEMVVMARQGTRIAQWAEAALPEVDIALVSLGTNDMRLLQPETEREVLALLVQRLHAAAGRVVWLAPPVMPFPDRGVRAMIAGAGVEVFPSLGLTIARGPDAVHPTAAGYAGWAAAIWRWLG